MKLLKKRRYQVILGVIVFFIIFACVGIYFWYSGNSNPQQSIQDENASEDQVQTLSPSAIGLKIEASSDDKKVRFVINDASDIKGIEYELVYNANATADELSEGAEAQVQRGITGQENITPGTSTYTSTWLILGSQSANMIRYDTGVKGVSITLKITKTNNAVYQVQDSIKF
jgi:hypothetical protein